MNNPEFKCCNCDAPSEENSLWPIFGDFIGAANESMCNCQIRWRVMPPLIYSKVSKIAQMTHIVLEHLDARERESTNRLMALDIHAHLAHIYVFVYMWSGGVWNIYVKCGCAKYAWV